MDMATFMQRLGRIKQRLARAAQHYDISTAADPDGQRAHVRKATRPKPRHQTLGSHLELDPNTGRTHRVLV